MSGGVRLGSYKSHEAGDETSIHPVFFDQHPNPDLDDESRPSLHHAISVTRPHKNQVVRDDLSFVVSGEAAAAVQEERFGGQGHGRRGGQGHELWSREGRQVTFPEDWHGPPAHRMAEAGLLYQSQLTSSKGYVLCAFCPVRFRQWASGDDPWEMHACFSSACCFVRLANIMKSRRFRHSCTSIDFLGRY